jgi:hypothetical protein
MTVMGSARQNNEYRRDLDWQSRLTPELTSGKKRLLLRSVNPLFGLRETIAKRNQS